jgi:3-oxoacyl-[acyl-carrier protein] reductase
MSLDKKIIIVSGGSRGIGRAIVIKLAGMGAKVAFTYVNNKKAAMEVVDEVGALNGSAMAYCVDIRNKEQVKGMLDLVIEQWGDLDVIVNNAGIRRDKPFPMLSDEEWGDVLKTNLDGTFHLTQAGILHLLKKRQGRIINISSVSGINGIAGQTNYSSSKAALLGFTRALAKEVSRYGISVNAVAPGVVETDFLDGLSEMEKERLLQGIPIGRWGRAEEIANVVAFLADDAASPEFLTGSVITIDGGSGL